MVQNAKLELAVATARMRAQNSKAVPVNIKLQVEDLPPDFSSKLINQFTSDNTLWDVFKHFEKKSGIVFTTRAAPRHTTVNSGELFYEIPIVQSFNGKISDLKEFSKSLAELGIKNRQENLRIRFELTDIPYVDALELQKELFSESAQPTEAQPKHAQASVAIASEEIRKQKLVQAEAPSATVTSAPIATADSQIEGTEQKKEKELVSNGRSVKVYLPSDVERKIENEADNVYTPSLAQSQRYQSQIQRSTKASEGPLLTQNLREQMENEKIKKIADLQIRIRLPDLTHIQATFKPSETIGHVVDFVKSSLSNPELPFKLFTNPPKRYFADSTHTLSRECKFGPRNLLFLEWDFESGVPKSSFPVNSILKKEFLSTGTSIINSPDISRANTAASESSQPSKPTASNEKGSKKGSLSDAQKQKLLKFIKTGKK